MLSSVESFVSYGFQQRGLIYGALTQEFNPFTKQVLHITLLLLFYIYISDVFWRYNLTCVSLKSLSCAFLGW